MLARNIIQVDFWWVMNSILRVWAFLLSRLLLKFLRNDVSVFFPLLWPPISQNFQFYSLFSSTCMPLCAVFSKVAIPSILFWVVNYFNFLRLAPRFSCSSQIPGNTGTIARTCAASAVGLHLVEVDFAPCCMSYMLFLLPFWDAYIRFTSKL